MDILLLGGTGAIGSALCSVLTNKGYHVCVTTRDVIKTTKLIKNNCVELIQGNAKNLQFIKEILELKQFDVIVDFMVYTTAEFKERYNLFLNEANHYIFLSSSRVYSDNKGERIIENNKRLLEVCDDKKFLVSGEYAIEKALQEDILTCSDKHNYTIVRPYITYNTERLQLGCFEKERWLYRALNGKKVVFFEDVGLKETALTYAKDVACRISKIIEKSAYGTYHIATEECLKWSDILEIYKRAFFECTGREMEVCLLKKVSDYYGKNGVPYSYIYDRLYDRKFDSNKINRLDVENSLDDFAKIDDTLKMCISDFLLNPSFRTISWMHEAAMDKITGDFTKIVDINGIKNKLIYFLIRYCCIPLRLIYFIANLFNKKS